MILKKDKDWKLYHTGYGIYILCTHCDSPWRGFIYRFHNTGCSNYNTPTQPEESLLRMRDMMIALRKLKR